jgi:hypothetical protein
VPASPLDPCWEAVRGFRIYIESGDINIEIDCINRLIIYFLVDLFSMKRSAVCENSDGCSAAVLGRTVDPGPGRRDVGTGNLSPWLTWDCDGDPFPPLSGSGVDSDAPRTFPVFELGDWRFTVKTTDRPLIEELATFVREIIDLPRADAKFTFKLVHCTEEERLGGWAWQKERVLSG